MASNVGIGIHRVIQDVDGESATVSNGRLDVNATIQAGDLNVGNVDIVSVPAPLSTTGDGTRSGVLRVTLASDSSMPASEGHASLISNANLAVSDTTREQLTTNSVPCKHIDIMPSLSNTGVIYVGGDTVGAGNGIALYAGDVYSMDVTNVNLVYVLASVDAENIQWISYN